MPGKAYLLVALSVLPAFVQAEHRPDVVCAGTDHWAYVKPMRPALPAVKNAVWPVNAIDHFILARLEREALSPSPPADRARLLRRVTLDLIGLPPTIEEVDTFVQDTRPDAYERVVERLLASPHYGERWARYWLDLARYADSNGFQRDGFREVWPYRDWVVHAFNADMPFDRFTVEQIAGDLLPGATVEQRIATGFNRGPTVNVEAGTDEEENRVNAVIDRVSTTATVWLGTTMSCAQCHNHKYDQFSQEEYYRLFAYFNSTAQETRGGEAAVREFIGPKLTLPLSPEKEKQRQELEARRKPLAAELSGLAAKVAQGQVAWESEISTRKELLAKLPPEVRKLLNVPEAKRNKKQKLELSDYFTNLDPAVRGLRAKLAEVDTQLLDLQPATTLIMEELPTPRPTHVLKRGNFRERGKKVSPGVPAVLHPLPADAPPNRLGLARWLTDPANPLVGRVTVNRWWAEFFGHGLVETLEDFGTQAEPPTHPELLDWLAVDFAERGWSMKAIHRLIVTSTTYRQSSRLTPALLQKDPQNKLYARGPRVRLSAETVRDNALAVSGLLCRKAGGPPVRPPQPPGIWTVTGVVDNTYRTSEGEDRYRRGLYTVWRRSSPYPSFVAFDAPDRAACVVQRPRTNTPLQALTLMNDPVYVEAAVALAGRMLNDRDGLSLRERLVYGFRLCLGRQPEEDEIAVLDRVYRRALARYEGDPAAARQVLKGAGQQNGADPVQNAAWFQVATVFLNLDEMIMK
jgi:hypothetical protein